MQVIVSPYDPQWTTQFEAIKKNLSATLHQNKVSYISIEHVGSTSIPNMPAKPIIDIDIIIEAQNLNEAIKAFTGGSTQISALPGNKQQSLLTTAIAPDDVQVQGAKYVYRGDMGIPDRHVLSYIPHLDTNRYYSPNTKLELSNPASPSLSLPSTEAKRNLYICIVGSPSLKNHLAVRNLCRMHPEIHQRYANTKLELSNRDWKTVDEYAEAKSDVISWILEQATDLDPENTVTINEILGIKDANTLAAK